MKLPGPDDSWEDVGEDVEEPETGTLPWPWLLALLAAAAWFPLDSFWQSEDFTALHRALDFRQVLDDFGGQQSRAMDLWWFSQPFITLSFWLDNQISGADPFLPHLANALVHGMSAMLLGLIWTRFISTAGAWGAALLWGLAPSHAGSISWVVGRVEGFSAFWCLLSLWLLCRWWEGRSRARLGSLLALAVALGCNEIAMVVPGLALLLCFGMSRGKRMRGAVRGAAPYFLVLGLFLIWRFQTLHIFVGGYTDYSKEPMAMFTGLGQTVLYLLDPMFYAGGKVQAAWLGQATPPWVPWLGLLPALLALGVLLLRRRFGLLCCTLVAFLAICIPMAPIWSGAADIVNLRHYYLPFAALVGLVGAGGVGIWLLAVLVWVTPFLETRADYRAFHRELAATHHQLLIDTLAEEPQMLFVADLPRQNAEGNVVGFHRGVDRILAPPFAGGNHRVFALRPLADIPGVHRLDDREEYMLPEGLTFGFQGSTILLRRMETIRLPDLRVRLDAPARLTSVWLRRLARGEEEGSLVMEGVRATHYRITVFTAGGYLAAIAPDRGSPGAKDGRVELANLFGDDGRYARSGPDAILSLGLQIPIAIDRSTFFPVLIEAGRLVNAGGTPFFRATHSARRFLWLEFDRDFPAMVAEVQGR